MRKSDKGLMLQDLDRLFRCGTVSSGDGALLESFLTEGNESAFEALVNRHGPMVRGVCRRLLASPHDADDAFQATFLVLVRKGRRLRDPDRLGPWLHGVATREALKARAGRRKDQAIVDVPAREGSDADWCDVMPIIDAELARLPAKHRDVLVACMLDGATTEEASHRLGCPAGTVKSRLSRARDVLRARLTSRGVAPAVALAALTTTDSFVFASPVSSTLTRATLKTVTTKAVAPGVVALIKGVAPTMLSKSTFTALVLAGGVGLAPFVATVWIKPSLAQAHLPQAQDQSKNQAQEQGRNPAPIRVPPAGTSGTKVGHQRLKQILAAVHNYVAANNTFPAAISDEAGQPLLSWRVALLPYLGEEELYHQFHLDEPWDGPHNINLAYRMPAVFETPDSPAEHKGLTRIRGFAGKGAVFDPTLTTAVGINEGASGTTGAERGTAKPRGAYMAEITDGTSNTVFLSFAKQAAFWTAPGELPFVSGQDLPALDADKSGYVTLAMCDGSVHFLRAEKSKALAGLITRAGGEVFSSNVFTMPAGLVLTSQVQPPDVLPTMPTPSSSVEERLQKVEEKLDRLLEKLDAK